MIPQDSYLNLITCVNFISSQYMKDYSYPVLINLDFQIAIPSVRLTHSGDTTNLDRRPDLYLIDVDQLDLEDLLGNLRYDTSFNPRARWIFLSQKPDSSIFQIIFDYHILEAILVEMNTNVEQRIFSYDPYKTNSYNDVIMEMQQVGTCVGGNLSFVAVSNLFPARVPKNWHNTTLQASYKCTAPFTLCSEDTLQGIEYELLRNIFTQFGIEVNYTEYTDRDPNGFKQNGSYTGIFELIYHNKVDFIFGNILWNGDKASDFDASATYFKETFSWYVPRPEKLPRWRYALMIFDRNTWTFCALSFVSLTVVWCVVDYMQLRQQPMRLLCNRIFDVSRLLLDQTLNFKLTGVSKIIILTSCLSFTYTLSTMYKSKITYFLSGNIEEKPVKNLDDVMEANMAIGATDLATDFYKEDQNFYEYSKKNLVICDASFACLNRTAFERDLVSARFEKKVIYYQDQYYRDQNGYLLIEALEDVIFRLHVKTYFSKGHPVFPKFNEYLSRLMSAGLIETIGSRRYKSKPEEPLHLAIVKLTFDHLKAPFFIMFVGLLTSIIFFLIEVVYSKMNKPSDVILQYIP